MNPPQDFINLNVKKELRKQMTTEDNLKKEIDPLDEIFVKEHNEFSTLSKDDLINNLKIAIKNIKRLERKVNKRMNTPEGFAWGNGYDVGKEKGYSLAKSETLKKVFEEIDNIKFKPKGSFPYYNERDISLLKRELTQKLKELDLKNEPPTR